MTNTYSLALSICFLDQLGDEVDQTLIQALATRLVGGQKLDGSWSYDCQVLDNDDTRRLRAAVDGLYELTTKPKEAGSVKPAELPKEIKAQLIVASRVRLLDKRRGDNSNTQFAVLGLWAARRHGIPVGPALALAEGRFRTTQSVKNGGWSYITGDKPGTTPAMTAAGLIGLATGSAIGGRSLRTLPPPKGAARKIATARRFADPAIQAGLDYLEVCASVPPGEGPSPITTKKVYYVLWSIERMALAYSLETLGQIDWYDWGKAYILKHQNEDGGWTNGEFHHGGADSCFALLFLKKADLLKGVGRVLRAKADPDAAAEEKPAAEKGKGRLDPPAKGKEMNTVPLPERPALRTPPAKSSDDDAPAKKLVEQYSKSGPLGRKELLKTFRDTKGVEYSDAIAMLIKRLDGDEKRQARLAFAERMSRMTPKTLKEKLKEEDPEVRRAAALAVAAREQFDMVDNVIDLLNDKEEIVRAAAYAALKALSETRTDTHQVERARALEAVKRKK